MTEIASRLVARHERDTVAAALPPRIEDLEPVKRLMLAVLDRAVNDFRAYAAVPTPRAKRLFADVDAWFHAPTSGPFDFETICDATGLDPDFIRRGLRASAATTGVGP